MKIANIELGERALLLAPMENVTDPGEMLRWNSFDLEIVDMDGVRIDKILVTHDQVSES